MGEVSPLASVDVTHGLCERCADRLEAGESLESLVEEYGERVSFYRELFAAARKGDQSSCEALIARARASDVGREELLIGLLQPALVQIGTLWERAEVTVSDEHRFTRWCNTMLDHLAMAPTEEGPLDLLLLPAPGNIHSVGLRIAEQVLLGRRVRCRAFLEPLTAPEVLALCDRYQPSWLGISCALAHMVEAALSLHRALVDLGHEPRLILSGLAIRTYPQTWQHPAIVACPTVADALSVIRSAREARTA